MCSIFWHCINTPTLGHTSHSYFNIPLDVDDTSHYCNIPKNGFEADLVKQTVASIWDEVLMQYRYYMEAVDCTLKDILDSNSYLWQYVHIFSFGSEHEVWAESRGLHSGSFLLVRVPICSTVVWSILCHFLIM